MFVTAKEFSKVIHELGLSNKDASKGLIDSHVEWLDKDGVMIGYIINDGINRTTHHLDEKYLPLITN